MVAVVAPTCLYNKRPPKTYSTSDDKPQTPLLIIACPYSTCLARLPFLQKFNPKQLKPKPYLNPKPIKMGLLFKGLFFQGFGFPVQENAAFGASTLNPKPYRAVVRVLEHRVEGCRL